MGETVSEGIPKTAFPFCLFTLCPVVLMTSEINKIYIIEKRMDLNLKKIISHDTATSSRTEGSRVFEIKLI